MSINEILNQISPLPLHEGLQRDEAEDTRQIISADGHHVAQVAVSPTLEQTHYLIHCANKLPSLVSAVRAYLDAIDNSTEAVLRRGLMVSDLDRVAAKSKLLQALHEAEEVQVQTP